IEEAKPRRLRAHVEDRRALVEVRSEIHRLFPALNEIAAARRRRALNRHGFQPSESPSLRSRLRGRMTRRSRLTFAGTAVSEHRWRRRGILAWNTAKRCSDPVDGRSALEVTRDRVDPALQTKVVACVRPDLHVDAIDAHGRRSDEPQSLGFVIALDP